MKKIAFAIAPIIFILDQLTKLIISKTIPYGSSLEIIKGYFDIVNIRNTGVAFGVLSGSHGSWKYIIFYGAAIAAVIVLAYVYKNLPRNSKLMPIAVGLLWGGIAGNVLDRIMYGSVVDFLSFHIRDAVLSGFFLGRHWIVPLSWPAFNVADMAITTAVGLFLISTFKEKT